MINISPVSDLRNYRTVLEKVDEGSPVYLTVNGHGKYAIHAIEDEEDMERTKGMLLLMQELYAGRKSGEEQGYVPAEDVHAHLRARLAQKVAERG